MTRTVPKQYMTTTGHTGGDSWCFLRYIKSRPFLAVLFCLVFALYAIACESADTTPSAGTAPAATPTETPASTPPETPAPVPHAHIDPSLRWPDSISQMILRSDVIVRASMASVTADFETLVHEGVTYYRPVHKYTFTTHEYLKGSGTPNILVVARDLTRFTSQQRARAATEDALSKRHSTWDNRQALLFLIRDTTDWYREWIVMDGLTYEGTDDNFVFPIRGQYPRSFTHPRVVLHHTIASLYRVWLPAASDTIPDDVDDIEFITDGAASPQPVSTLGDMKARIAEWTALWKAAEGDPAYGSCLHSRITRERTDKVFETLAFENTVERGANYVTVAISDTVDADRDATAYHNYWVNGPDEALFQAIRHDDDSNFKNGYSYSIESVRPLPAGTYDIDKYRQSYWHIPCNFRPATPFSTWTINVTAPPGTLHELFFDPVTLGNAALANEDYGVLKPMAFTGTNNQPATITSIAYDAPGRVQVSVDPIDAVTTNHRIDFIDTDGSVRLSLDFADANKDTANNTWWWPVERKPFSGGDTRNSSKDRLMARIYLPPLSKSPADFTGMARLRPVRPTG